MSAGRSLPRLALVVGTRPEAIKVAPVVLAARREGLLEPVVIVTGQHDELAERALGHFGVAADRRLVLPPRADGSQVGLVAPLLTTLDQVLAEVDPAAVMVQGDTASALAGALAGLWHQRPVVHLEAGLRSFDLADPFPEEAYRRLIGQVTSLHLPPTAGAAAHLAAEGVDPDRIRCVGNTVVDAALLMADRPPSATVPAVAQGHRLVLVTVHRRESWGAPLQAILEAVADLVEQVPDIEVVLPVHPNPLVRNPVRAALGHLERVQVVEPLDHPDLIALLRRATLVLTDSGGIQEEAPSFGTPTLVLRRTTERPEAIEAGCAALVGTTRPAIVERAAALLTDEPARRQMARVANPFGDGQAGPRAVRETAAMIERQR